MIKAALLGVLFAFCGIRVLTHISRLERGVSYPFNLVQVELLVIWIVLALLAFLSAYEQVKR